MQLAAVSPYNPVVLSTVKATKIVDIFGNFSNGRKVDSIWQRWFF